jgi:uncharacterized protein (DUF885 family)
MIVLHPYESASAYIGYQAILDIEKEYKKVKGEAFSQKEFLKKLVSYGSLPLHVLRTKFAQ